MDALEELAALGFGLDPDWFEPHLAFRFPHVGTGRIPTAWSWNCATPWNPGTCWARNRRPPAPCAMSTVRWNGVQARVSGWVDERYVLACNGTAVPLTRTDREGEYVGGVRFKAWNPPSSLHPTIGVHVAAGVRRVRPLERAQPRRPDLPRRPPRRPQLRHLPGQRQRSRGPPPRPLLPVRPHPGPNARAGRASGHASIPGRWICGGCNTRPHRQQDKQRGENDWAATSVFSRHGRDTSCHYRNKKISPTKPFSADGLP